VECNLYPFFPKNINFTLPTYLSKNTFTKRWGDGCTLRAPKKAQVRACAEKNNYQGEYIMKQTKKQVTKSGHVKTKGFSTLALSLAVIAAGITGITLGFKKRNEGGEG
jgi:hypothetical protein